VKLSHFETKVRFSEKTKVATPAFSVFRELTGKEDSGDDKAREPGVRIRDEKLKRLVYWHYDSCSVLYEDRQDYDLCVNDVVALLGRIDKVAPIREPESMELRADWILPVMNHDFRSLEKKYRENFIRQHPIFDTCYDSSVVMYMKQNELILHHQSGAMNIEQLRKDYRVFPLEKMKCELFLFLYSAVANNGKTMYSSEKMKAFLDEALKMCKNHADLFQRMMEGVL